MSVSEQKRVWLNRLGKGGGVLPSTVQALWLIFELALGLCYTLQFLFLFLILRQRTIYCTKEQNTFPTEARLAPSLLSILKDPLVQADKCLPGKQGALIRHAVLFSF